MSAIQMWTIDEVAAYIGASSSGSARKTLSRWGVTALRYGLSPNGRPQALYAAAQVQAAHATRPGQGARTDRPSGQRRKPA